VTPVSDPGLNAPAETVTLTVPGRPQYIGIARLFVGGLAARLRLGYETMDDLQLALESVLSKAELRDRVTLEAHVEGEGVALLVGPFAHDPLGGERHPEQLELQRLLSALVAGTESTTREDGCWLRLDVRIPAGSETA
jgi:hypothetical protein